VIDSLLVPGCRRAVAGVAARCVGTSVCSDCAATEKKLFGWRLHRVCTLAGEPVHLTLLPASLYDLTPVHELAEALPAGTALLGNKACISAL
jgi:hypothetical protein